MTKRKGKIPNKNWNYRIEELLTHSKNWVKPLKCHMCPRGN